MMREEADEDEVSDLLSAAEMQSAISTTVDETRIPSRIRHQPSSQRLLQMSSPAGRRSWQESYRQGWNKPLVAAKLGAVLLVVGGAAKYFAYASSNVQGDDRDLQDKASVDDVIRPVGKGVVLPDKVLREVQAGLRHAMQAQKEAKDLHRQAQGVKGESESLAEGAEDLNRRAGEEMDVAMQAATKAKKLRKEALHELQEAKDWDKKATDERKKAKDTENSAKMSIDMARDEQKNEIQASEKALQDTYDRRLCVDLPGVRLAGSVPQRFPETFVKADTDTPESCTVWCRKHEACKQAGFDHGAPPGERCDMFTEATAKPRDFEDSFNSSYCGVMSEKDAMMGMIKQSYGFKPWVPEPRKCSWAGENCLSSTCCANACVPGKNATGGEECSWYTCYRKDKLTAHCVTGLPPPSWNGTKIGGHPVRKVPKADDGVLIQDTTLFCFTVVLWDQPPEAGSDGEGVVANNFKEKNFGIMQCDAQQFVDGLLSGSRLDNMLSAWRRVREVGTWKQFDWTVKVDVDTVFIPDRLRWHLKDLRVPRGSRLYVRNMEKHPFFSDTVQVLSREAARLYFQRGDECTGQIGNEGGIEYWMLSCLEGLGVDFQDDLRIIGDESSSTGPGDVEACSDDWAAAFSGFDSVVDWEACQQAAELAREAKQHLISVKK